MENMHKRFYKGSYKEIFDTRSMKKYFSNVI